VHRRQPHPDAEHCAAALAPATGTAPAALDERAPAADETDVHLPPLRVLRELPTGVKQAKQATWHLYRSTVAQSLSFDFRVPPGAFVAHYASFVDAAVLRVACACLGFRLDMLIPRGAVVQQLAAHRGPLGRLLQRLRPVDHDAPA